jgi:hypothetical protein
MAYPLYARENSSVIERRVANGRLHPIMAGVYAVGRPELTRRGRWMVAVLACGMLRMPQSPRWLVMSGRRLDSGRGRGRHYQRRLHRPRPAPARPRRAAHAADSRRLRHIDLALRPRRRLHRRRWQHPLLDRRDRKPDGLRRLLRDFTLYFCWKFVPETKGKRLEDIQEYFQERVDRRGTADV